MACIRQYRSSKDGELTVEEGTWTQRHQQATSISILRSMVWKLGEPPMAAQLMADDRRPLSHDTILTSREPTPMAVSSTSSLPAMSLVVALVLVLCTGTCHAARRLADDTTPAAAPAAVPAIPAVPKPTVPAVPTVPQNPVVPAVTGVPPMPAVPAVTVPAMPTAALPPVPAVVVPAVPKVTLPPMPSVPAGIPTVTLPTMPSMSIPGVPTIPFLAPPPKA
ncbi:hypothetical protein HU200_028035 [Digitaria exilis]|uniref:Uncharacterized protein n=1 Tax=Digitaria exilis TaxID=1010633 RepID=A0A835EQG3_9POAL|nr:hypothetical protein HU200_028035 [Digitaria exilis]